MNSLASNFGIVGELNSYTPTVFPAFYAITMANKDVACKDLV